MNEDIKQTKHDDIGVDNQQEDNTEGKDENGLNDVMHPVDVETEAQVSPEVESLQKEMTKEEDTKDPKDDEERVENLKDTEEDGEECDVQSAEEEEDFDKNEANEKDNKENLHPMADLSPHPKITPEEVVRASSEPSRQYDEDLIKTICTERRSSLKKEHKRPTEEHHGEGDAHYSEEPSPTPPEAQDILNPRTLISLAVLIAVIAAVVFWLWKTDPQPAKKEFNLLDVFRQEMDKVQSSFPNQHKELWRRSRIHLQRHLQINHPSEPVSLILTAGHGAEKTLGCLAQRLAAAFSTALNASTLDIYGINKTAQDSDQVKLDIDKTLREAFDGGKQAAVIHRFEELPPGSTLIFYRYCDHENAAYKNVFLAFTVLLEEELEVPPSISLGMVEEMVQDYLKEKFVSSERTTMFNQMDVDKLSGLWSRISHLILPVAAEVMIERHGCGELG